jgi:hypothetical protein
VAFGIYRHILLKLSSIKFYGNASGGSHIHTRKKLIDAFLHVFFTNVLNQQQVVHFVFAMIPVWSFIIRQNMEHAKL